MIFKFPELHTDRIWLRQILPTDAKKVYEGLSNEEVTQFYAVHYTSLEATQEQMDWYQQLWKKKTGIWWAICTKPAHDFMGTFGYYRLDRKKAFAEIGYWLLPEFWGKGYASEGLITIIEYGRTILKLKTIEAHVEVENLASARLLLKLGFRQTQFLKDSEIKNGRFISVAVYTWDAQTPT